MKNLQRICKAFVILICVYLCVVTISTIIAMATDSEVAKQVVSFLNPKIR